MGATDPRLPCSPFAPTPSPRILIATTMPSSTSSGLSSPRSGRSRLLGSPLLAAFLALLLLPSLAAAFFEQFFQQQHAQQQAAQRAPSWDEQLEKGELL